MKIAYLHISDDGTTSYSERLTLLDPFSKPTSREAVRDEMCETLESLLERGDKELYRQGFKDTIDFLSRGTKFYANFDIESGYYSVVVEDSKLS